MGNILPVQNDLSICHIFQPCDQPCNCTFSASGFTHNSKDFSWIQTKAYIIYCRNIPFFTLMKYFFQMIYL